jgi:hypothetical protein
VRERARSQTDCHTRAIYFVFQNFTQNHTLLTPAHTHMPTPPFLPRRPLANPEFRSFQTNYLRVNPIMPTRASLRWQCINNCPCISADDACMSLNVWMLHEDHSVTHRPITVVVTTAHASVLTMHVCH